MHRLLMGDPNGMVIDHKDRNGLNNRRENLRVCTHSENIRNSRRVKRSETSPSKGVNKRLTKNGFKYQAMIRFSGKNYKLGDFDCLEDAIAAYKEGALRMHGEFAAF